jgi:hypothetical protein
VDALDEGFFESHNQHWQFALQRTLHPEHLLLPTIITCRPEASPDALACNRFQIPPVDMNDAVLGAQSVIAQQQSHALSRQQLEMALQRLDATSVPLFLSILTENPGLVEIPATSRNVSDARFALLSSWQAPLVESYGNELGLLALAFFNVSAYELPYDTVIDTAEQLSNLPTADLRLALDASISSGLLHLRHQTHNDVVQLRHPLLLVFMAASSLSDLWEEHHEALVDSALPEAAEAVAWASLRSHHPEEWMARASSLRSKSAAAMAMARVSSVTGLPLAEGFYDAVTSAQWKGETQQREFVRSLALLPSSPALIRCLISLLSSSSYSVRWEAAQTLSRVGDAKGELVAWLEKLASNVEDTDYRMKNPLCLQEGALWFGPSICHEEGTTTSQTFSRIYEAVVTACNRKEPGSLGAESSLAQGLKLAAVAGKPVEERHLRFVITEAKFWFARFEGVLALGMLPSEIQESFGDLLQASLDDAHPFVRAAARIVKSARGTPEVNNSLWLNESEAVRDGRSQLTPESIILLADVVLLLSMCSEGSQDERDENAVRNSLPLCIRSGQDRNRLTSDSACPLACGFRICPFRYAKAGYWNRGPFPEAFCRSVRHAVSAAGPPAWYKGSARSYLALWIQIEHDMSLKRT